MHLTDEHLNEYLDHESSDCAQIELHLAVCEECSARLNALRALFADIESLTDVELSSGFSARFASVPGLSDRLPRTLRFTVILQAALTVAALLLAAPWIVRLISTHTFEVSVPSSTEILLQLQGRWMVWLNALSTLPAPSIPEVPVIDLSSLLASFTILGVSLLWLVGNGLLLRNSVK